MLAGFLSGLHTREDEGVTLSTGHSEVSAQGPSLEQNLLECMHHSLITTTVCFPNEVYIGSTYFDYGYSDCDKRY